jgi:hypothetical protein
MFETRTLNVVANPIRLAAPKNLSVDYMIILKLILVKV